MVSSPSVRHKSFIPVVLWKESLQNFGGNVKNRCRSSATHRCSRTFYNFFTTFPIVSFAGALWKVRGDADACQQCRPKYLAKVSVVAVCCRDEKKEENIFNSMRFFLQTTPDIDRCVKYLMGINIDMLLSCSFT